MNPFLDISGVRSCRGLFVIGLFLIVLGKSPCHADPAPKANQGASVGQSASDNIDNKDFPSAGNPVTTSTSTRTSDKPFSSIFSGTLWTALFFVLVIIFVAAWVLRKAYPGANVLFGGLSVVQVLGRTPLSAKQTLVLVRFDRRLILLGVTDHQINSVLTVDDPDEAARVAAVIEQSRPSSLTAGFKQLFHRETAQIDRHQELWREGSEKTLNKIEENEVLELKNELNSLINKVKELKGIGSRNQSS